jgi:hypothetical protein
MQVGLGFLMNFNSLAGDAYQLQRSADLKNWNNWMSFEGTGQPMHFTDSSALVAPQMYYRVQYQQ